MKQPDIGLKVAELRRQKNMTQEELAEICEVSIRTIQRIESGEVEPRAFTNNSLSNVLEFDFGQDNTENENFWLAVLHLSSMFIIVLIPLLLWSWKKNQSYEIDRQGRLVLNYQITMTITLLAMLFLLLVVPVALAFMGEAGINTAGGSPIFMLLVMCGTAPLLLIGLFSFYQAIVNTIRSLSGQPIHYSLSIQFLK